MEAEFDNDRLVADELDQVGEYGTIRNAYRALALSGRVMKSFMVQSWRDLRIYSRRKRSSGDAGSEGYYTYLYKDV